MHANYASNNKKRDNVKIIRIVLDLQDAIVDNFHIVTFFVVTSIISMHFFLLINSTYNAL